MVQEFSVTVGDDMTPVVVILSTTVKGGWYRVVSSTRYLRENDYPYAEGDVLLVDADSKQVANLRTGNIEAIWVDEDTDVSKKSDSVLHIEFMSKRCVKIHIK